jgi:Putative phage tail protein
MSGLFGGGGGTNTVTQTATPVNSLYLQTSTRGTPVPLVYGKARVQANLIYYNDFIVVPHYSTQTQGGGGGKGGGGGASTTTTISYTYTAGILMGLCEGPINDITTTWRDKETYVGSNSPSQIGLAFVPGSYSQSPMGWVSTGHPSDAFYYRGTCIVGGGGYTIGSNGGMQNHSFEVDSGFGYSGTIRDANPKDVIVDLMTNLNSGSGFPASKIGDLTQFSNYCIANNIFISPVYMNQSPATTMISSILTLCNSAPVFSEGVFKIIPFGDVVANANGVTYTPNVTPLYDLTDDDFIGSSAADPIIVTRKPQSDSYNDIQIKFPDRVGGYNDEIQEAKDEANINLYGLRTMQVINAPEIVDTNVARSVAQIILQRQLYIRSIFAFKLGWKYALLEPMDLVTLTDSGLGMNKLPVRILSVEENDSGELNITAEEFPLGIANASLYASQASNAYAANYNASAGNVYAPVIFEPPVALATSSEFLDVWIAAGGGALFGGYEVWLSLDNATYKRVAAVNGVVRYGTLTATLASQPSPGIVAQTASVNLLAGGQMYSGTLQDNQLVVNTLCYSNGEYFSYQNATLTGTNAYNLTPINRGAYGSGQPAHAIGDSFVRVDDTIGKIPLTADYLGKTIYLKLLSVNQFGGGKQQLSAVSPYIYTVTGKFLLMPPSDVAGFAYSLENFGITLSWTANTDKDLKTYEIRVGGTDWASSVFVAQTNSTKYFTKPSVSGSLTYRIKAIDTTGNYSVNAVTTAVTIAVPTTSAATVSIAGQNAVVSWPASSGAFAIDHYEVRYGASWAAGTFLTTITGTSFTEKVSYSGTRTYWVAAVDVAGNVATASSASITINPPTMTTVTPQVIDNNVLLYWTDSTATLPIQSYEVRRGATYAGSTLIGTKQGLFTTVFESAGGVYTYWITGIDTAGNYGTPKQTTTTVNQPPDFVLHAAFNSTFSGTLSNALVENGTLVIPVNTTETYAAHFTTHSWTSPQDQITAGFPIYIEPALSPGYYEETFDVGTVLSSNKITLTTNGSIIAGAPTIATIISTSPDNVTYTNYPGVTSVFATGFRYVKVRITVSGGTADLYRLNSLNVTINSKLINDAGSVSALASDVGGTVVFFNIPFIAVSSINVSANSTTPVTTIFDFASVPNPTSFKVLVFNSAGTRVNATVTWAAKGN